MSSNRIGILPNPGRIAGRPPSSPMKTTLLTVRDMVTHFSSHGRVVGCVPCQTVLCPLEVPTGTSALNASGGTRCRSGTVRPVEHAGDQALVEHQVRRSRSTEARAFTSWRASSWCRSSIRSLRAHNVHNTLEPSAAIPPNKGAMARPPMSGA